AEATGIAPALIVARGMQLRLQAERGEGTQVTEAEQLADRARATGVPVWMLFGLAAASQALLAAGDHTQAQVLLRELAQLLGRVSSGFYTDVVLPDIVRCALKLSEPELAAQLTRAFEPHTPAQKHAAVACRAQVAEAAGN